MVLTNWHFVTEIYKEVIVYIVIDRSTWVIHYFLFAYKFFNRILKPSKPTFLVIQYFLKLILYLLFDHKLLVLLNNFFMLILFCFSTSQWTDNITRKYILFLLMHGRFTFSLSWKRSTPNINTFQDLDSVIRFFVRTESFLVNFNSKLSCLHEDLSSFFYLFLTNLSIMKLFPISCVTFSDLFDVTIIIWTCVSRLLRIVLSLWEV